ncbi:hypothetical protein EON64_10985, partial [archaeon]
MRDPFTSGSEHSRTFAGLTLVSTIVSTGASLLMLFLIRRMRIWNGHILLLATMTVFQTLYDITFFTGVVNMDNVYLAVASNVGQLMGGMASSFFSNIIGAIALYVIVYRHSFPIFRYFPSMLGFVVVTGTIDCVLFLLSVTVNHLDYLAGVAVLGLYYYAKVFSIVVNFVFALLTTLHVQRTSSRKATVSHSEQALQILSRRLFYYPIVQAVSRSGCAWYEVQYGYEFSPGTGMNFSPEHTSNWKFAAQCFMALSMPIASLGYLAIFLVMQPRAYATLVALVRGETLPSPSDLSASLLPHISRDSADHHEMSDWEGDWDGDEDWRPSHSLSQP